MNSYSGSASEEFIGIDYQKKKILELIKQNRVIGLWGMGGIGKTTLADVVYMEVSNTFESCYFLQNVRGKIEKQGRESVRNEFLSMLLKDKEIRIDTPSIGYPYRERLNNLRVIVVLDDVNDPEQVDWMGVKHFGDGSKIILTSRDRQVLKNGGATQIHKVEELNEKYSLQLCSITAFKQLNPSVDFLYLSYEFVRLAHGSPLSLKILGAKLYSKCIEEWKSEVEKVNKFDEPKISQILKSSFDGLDKLQKDIFLDLVCFFKGESKEEVEKILSCLYKGAVSGLSSLLDKCLFDINSRGRISMHDMLEEMGKDIVDQESEYPEKRKRLWNPKHVYQVLNNNKGTDRIEGIKFYMSHRYNLKLRPTCFESMPNLRYIKFDVFERSLTNGDIDIAYLPNELKCLQWDCYPFKSLSLNFNPKNLVVLNLQAGNMEQLWNEDFQDLVNLREIDVSSCYNLRKIPNLLGAINLEILNCQ
ncbi:TMV resistance protein N-like [Hibiscus syriacus]|uniref:TMV resistance protein N-like n=1 Tax=Hibiscus syriacus TaxID=106335 RepID=UPI0019250EF6|nr:TMV resistance protein N-like [Hibiscus syriacus]